VSAVAIGGGGGYSGGSGDKSLKMSLVDTLRLAWADPDLRARIQFVLLVFAVFALGVHIPVPVPGIDSTKLIEKLGNNPALQYLNMFGGGALRKVSIFSLGLNPYITSSIIMQVLTNAFPNWKKELQEGGEYARKQQNKRTRFLTLFLCLFQGWGLLKIIAPAMPASANAVTDIVIITFWTAGAMFMLWLGEQVSEKGIGNGTSLMIFAGIILSLPNTIEQLVKGVQIGNVHWYSLVLVLVIFVAVTWLIVYFTTAQRRIPVQHMRRMVGTRMMGGQTSYLPFPVNSVGVIPIIFAVALLGIPGQLALMVGGESTSLGYTLARVGEFLRPDLTFPEGIVGIILYTALIFFFSYFWTAIQYNVEDISNNLKRGNSYIPGVRPGKQTKEFLDGVISRVTIVGAVFIAFVAILQYLSPRLTGVPTGYVSVIGGTSLLILVSVALETMRQIEANLLMKQYGQ
jgi:preprotein translocase subunit SecY